MNDKYILLVEDSPDEVFLTERAFKKGEVANPLEVVSDGKRALEFISSVCGNNVRDIGDKPTLILLAIG